MESARRRRAIVENGDDEGGAKRDIQDVRLGKTK